MKKLIAFSIFICSACLAAGEPTPVPESAPAPQIATTTPTPSPAPEIAQPRRQWMIAGSTDSTQQPFQSAATTYLISANRVNVERLPDGSYLVTFGP